MKIKNAPLIAIIIAVIAIIVFFAVGIYYNIKKGWIEVTPHMICMVSFLIIVLILTEILMKPQYHFIFRSRKPLEEEEEEEEE